MAIKGDSTDFEKGASVGTIFLVAAFSMIFFGIRNYRDKIADGVIDFNKGFRIGIQITVLGSVIYVIGWMINFHYIDTEFIENYIAFYSEKIKASGKPQLEIEKEITAFKANMANYENPFVMMMYTFLEVFPVGLIVSILCAMLMRKKAADKTT